MGGLKLLDLERLARALRLGWCRFQWKHDARPWNGLDIPCDKNDKDLFNASTVVKVGKSNKTNFWHSSWLDGRAPKNIAPCSFRKSKRKNFAIQKAMQDNYWIDQVCPLNTGEEIREYTSFWRGNTLTKMQPRSQG